MKAHTFFLLFLLWFVDFLSSLISENKKLHNERRLAETASEARGFHSTFVVLISYLLAHNNILIQTLLFSRGAGEGADQELPVSCYVVLLVSSLSVKQELLADITYLNSKGFYISFLEIHIFQPLCTNDARTALMICGNLEIRL